MNSFKKKHIDQGFKEIKNKRVKVQWISSQNLILPQTYN